MTEQLSFSRFEKEVLPNYRNKMNNAESTEDVKKFFVYTAQDFLVRVFTNGPRIEFEDITLTPNQTPAYTLSSRIVNDHQFSEVTKMSDLPYILERLAGTAAKRYNRLERNPEKSDSKIRA